MIRLEEALQRLLPGASPLTGNEQVCLSDALGRVLHDDIYASLDVPPADNSAMDGYAIRHSDCLSAASVDAGADTRGTEFGIPVSQRIAAGHPGSELRAGTAARIFTGAEIPTGADTVVMQENCEERDGLVFIRGYPRPGDNVRQRGQDVQTGSRLLAAGHRLRAQDLGLMASQGISELKVRKRLCVAIVSTGDELIEPGEAAGPGTIFNSNRYTLMGLLRGWGFDVLDLGIAEDKAESLAGTFRQAAQSADVIISTGGVSVGEEDHVKAVVDSLGSIDLWRIAIKPGKPFAFGQVIGTPFLGLPGNPVSVFVTLLIIGRPYLFACQGMHVPETPYIREPALFRKSASTREDYLRVKRTTSGLELFPSQSSGVLTSASWSDGLVRQSIGEEIQHGALVDYLPYSALV